MELILTQVELNEDFIPNSRALYDVWFSKGEFIAKLIDVSNDKRIVGFEDVPKTLRYKLDKPLHEFTKDEKENILAYRVLKLDEDGFELGDIFMEKSHTTLIGVDIKLKVIVTTTVEINEGESMQDLRNRYTHGSINEKNHGDDYTIEFV